MEQLRDIEKEKALSVATSQAAFEGELAGSEEASAGPNVGENGQAPGEEAGQQSSGAREEGPPDPQEEESGPDAPEPVILPVNVESMIGALVALKGIGPNDALLLCHEVFYRDFRNRRELASFVGLAPVSWASGPVSHEQGISKAGSSMLRKHMIQMAWRWLRWQPESDLSKWYRRYTDRQGGRMRKRAIVALARKLLVALWRYATTGLVPTGATHSASA